MPSKNSKKNTTVILVKCGYETILKLLIPATVGRENARLLLRCQENATVKKVSKDDARTPIKTQNGEKQ